MQVTGTSSQAHVQSPMASDLIGSRDWRVALRALHTQLASAHALPQLAALLPAWHHANAVVRHSARVLGATWWATLVQRGDPLPSLADMLRLATPFLQSDDGACITPTPSLTLTSANAAAAVAGCLGVQRMFLAMRSPATGATGVAADAAYCHYVALSSVTASVDASVDAVDDLDRSTKRIKPNSLEADRTATGPARLLLTQLCTHATVLDAIAQQSPDWDAIDAFAQVAMTVMAHAASPLEQSVNLLVSRTVPWLPRVIDAFNATVAIDTSHPAHFLLFVWQLLQCVADRLAESATAHFESNQMMELLMSLHRWAELFCLHGPASMLAASAAHHEEDDDDEDDEDQEHDDDDYEDEDEDEDDDDDDGEDDDDDEDEVQEEEQDDHHDDDDDDSEVDIRKRAHQVVGDRENDNTSALAQFVGMYADDVSDDDAPISLQRVPITDSTLIRCWPTSASIDGYCMRLQNLCRIKLLGLILPHASELSPDVATALAHALTTWHDELDNVAAGPRARLVARLVTYFAEDDDHLVALLSEVLTLHHLVTSSAPPSGVTLHCWRDLQQLFNPLLVWRDFLHLVAFDVTFVLDLCISDETVFLSYMLRLLKHLATQAHSPEAGHNRRLDAFWKELHHRIVELHARGLFPFDPRVLVCRLDAVMKP
jgi:hypothetical protein